MANATKSKIRILIRADRCKGCALCVQACPKGLLEMDMEALNAMGYHPVRITDQDQCTGCRLCALMCPDQGILFISNDEENG